MQSRILETLIHYLRLMLRTLLSNCVSLCISVSVPLIPRGSCDKYILVLDMLLLVCIGRRMVLELLVANPSSVYIHTIILHPFKLILFIMGQWLHRHMIWDLGLSR